MKLISCYKCAVVLDQDMLYFDKDIYKVDEETIDESKADYNQATGDWAAFVHCPVCNEKIFQR